MKVVHFSRYYIKFRLAVLTGSHQTKNPLGLRWRWKFWNTQQQRFFTRLY